MREEEENMTFKLLTCHRRQKRPKTNLASARKSSNAAKAKSSSRSHKKSSRTRRLHTKSSYLASNVLSKNFYPANYFFQDHQRARLYDSSTSRVGVNDHYGFLITARNPPQLPTMNSNHPRQRMAVQRMSQFTHSKVG